MAKAKQPEPENLPAQAAGGESRFLSVTAEKFPIFNLDPATVSDLITCNVGPSLKPSDLPRVSMPAGGATVWTLDSASGKETAPSIEGIIIYWRDTRAYWEHAFGMAPKGPPQCRSEDGIRGVGVPGGLCVKCPLSQFTDGEKPRCKAQRLVFFLKSGDLLPTAFFVPVTSIEALRHYFLNLVNAGKPFWHVITRFGLDSETNRGGIDYARLVPSMAGQLSKEQLPLLAEYMKAIKPALQAAAMRLQEQEEVVTGPIE